jgi:hypothetical protein
MDDSRVEQIITSTTPETANRVKIAKGSVASRGKTTSGTDEKGGETREQYG